MSLSESAAMAKAYGMTYGQYCLAKELGTLPNTPKHEVIPSAPEVRRTASGAVKWSKELVDYIWSMYTSGMKPEEIGRRTGIRSDKIRQKLKYIKRDEQHTEEKA